VVSACVVTLQRRTVTADSPIPWTGNRTQRQAKAGVAPGKHTKSALCQVAFATGVTKRARAAMERTELARLPAQHFAREM
jgi:hypothetical protein